MLVYIFKYKFTLHNIHVHVHYYFVIIVIERNFKQFSGKGRQSLHTHYENSQNANFLH